MMKLEESICKLLLLLLKIKTKYIPISGYLYRTGIASLFDKDNSYIFQPDDAHSYYKVYRRRLDGLQLGHTMVISQTKCPIFRLRQDPYDKTTINVKEISFEVMIHPMLVKYK